MDIWKVGAALHPKSKTPHGGSKMSTGVLPPDYTPVILNKSQNKTRKAQTLNSRPFHPKLNVQWKP